MCKKEGGGWRRRNPLQQEQLQPIMMNLKYRRRGFAAYHSPTPHIYQDLNFTRLRSAHCSFPPAKHAPHPICLASFCHHVTCCGHMSWTHTPFISVASEAGPYRHLFDPAMAISPRTGNARYEKQNIKRPKTAVERSFFSFCCLVFETCSGGRFKRRQL